MSTLAARRRFPQTKPRPWELPKPPADTSTVPGLLIALHRAGVTLTTDGEAVHFVGEWKRPIPDDLMTACEPHLIGLADYAARINACRPRFCSHCGGLDFRDEAGADRRVTGTRCLGCGRVS